MFERFFHFLGNRPVHERRILATTVYLALAAVILAVWITSLGRTIGSPGNADENRATAAREETGTTSSSEEKLSSPFEALKQSVQQIAEGVREIRQAWQNPGMALQQPASGATTTSIVANEAAIAIEPKSTPSASGIPPAFREIPAERATSTSALTASSKENASESLEELANLVSPIGAVTEPTSNAEQRATGFWATLRIGFNAASQTIINAYTAIFE